MSHLEVLEVTSFLGLRGGDISNFALDAKVHAPENKLHHCSHLGVFIKDF